MDERKGFIVKEGLNFVYVTGLVGILSGLMGFYVFAALNLLFSLFCAFFFRNPERTPPEDERIFVSPADGKVLRIDEVELTDPIEGSYKKVSVFMNVFNVHVNRIPYSGRVERVLYRTGKFLSANLDKASEDNEKNTVILTTEDGRKFMTVQIAGLIARRIICWISEGMSVSRGERFGLICFGSRVEIFLPAGASVLVKAGQRVRAGETPLGYDHEEKR
ncbi:MAG TPA: phosphatidylserine decarboxylase family protein [Syntrophales bacterium]|nr:phosphatidylserine decarboxylase family protein [Syntrophales bacterium]HOX93740.1 phosphatidylserine decarboxylase family protein [Syntrophales bacterium]HPI55881.1 phosphatidylserine decarboxylase family protein [Syntrophales bacterium]HPN23628.1 phosphatidylserine decarboxylase family protein [Syntrophales bacterium]HQM27847.1 phosphatidylserine decarboxylase family protein [Syntrophales bacterium]